MEQGSAGQFEDQPRFAGIREKAARVMETAKKIGGFIAPASKWTAPVFGEVLKEEAGIDFYDYIGSRQPDLSKSQRFGANALREGVRIFKEGLEPRAV